MKQLIFNADQVPTVAATLLSYIPSCKIFAFSGPLGAGKTTMVQTMLRMLGVSEDITSPTFTYLNLYRTDTFVICHFDLYRLGSTEEFLELGFDEYLHTPDVICLIEWPEIIMPLLQQYKTCFIMLDYYQGNMRTITLYVNDVNKNNKK